MDEADRSGASLRAARAAKAHVRDAFRGVADVVGVGLFAVGRGYGIKVNIVRPAHRGLRLPEEIEGVPLRVEIVGAIGKE